MVRPGGLVVACAGNRDSDPELLPRGYPPTSFDGEEAPEVIADVFGDDAVEVQRWDERLVHLADRAEVAAYARSHLIPADVVDTVEPPLTLTKRGCVVFVRRR